MQAVGAAVGVAFGCDRQEGRARHGELGASGGIGGVARSIGGNNEVRGIDAAGEVKADERLEIRRDRCGGGTSQGVARHCRHDAQLAKGGQDAGRPDGGATGLADEGAT